MNPRDLVDPELLPPLDGLMEATGGGFDLNDIPGTRAMLAGMVEGVKAAVPPIEGVEAEDLRIPGRADGPAVPARIYRPATAGAPLPVMVWLHGGGHVLGDVELDDLMLRQLCKDTGVALINVGYRLAPEHPYPAALEDTYATLLWTAEHAAEQRLDGGRIAVGGASAGGCLAAAAALMARDRGEIALAYQMLVYPSIDDSNVEQAGPDVPDTLFWTRENALQAWTAYLGGPPGRPGIPAYAAPARADDLSGLPPAWVGVGTVDPFLDEDLRYASRLAAAGVPVQLCAYPGAYHAFDVFAPESKLAARFVQDRNSALRAALGT